jgi:hypothetical protein
MNIYTLRKKIAVSITIMACLLAYGTFSKAQVCTDNYEPNNTYLQATPINPGDVVHALIDPSGDVDFYSFALTGNAHHIRAILSDLPANYDMTLYNSNSAKLASAKNKGKVNDTLIKNFSLLGTYYLKVNANQGKSNATKCYTLTLETSSIPYRLENYSSDVNSLVDFSLYPNPASTKLVLTSNTDFNSPVTISVFDLLGRKVLDNGRVQLTTGDEIGMDVSSLINGTYLLKVESETGSIVKKFSVQR